ncbi:hypothetical protein FNV43_RR20995 [Rhamnella rubrinervis]|uniref:Uncharacterized protein n=1 Tax=Rhamnella rubrinervis TaxID=2594499 RepID=A0A8K0GTY4_9ROSA|nr:hypothetical protein FNV43_RR20995 [Rhamnella rubrinervis]
MLYGKSKATPTTSTCLGAQPTKSKFWQLAATRRSTSNLKVYLQHPVHSETPVQIPYYTGASITSGLSTRVRSFLPPEVTTKVKKIDRAVTGETTRSRNVEIESANRTLFFVFFDAEVDSENRGFLLGGGLDGVQRDDVAATYPQRGNGLILEDILDFHNAILLPTLDSLTLNIAWHLLGVKYY